MPQAGKGWHPAGQYDQLQPGVWNMIISHIHHLEPLAVCPPSCLPEQFAPSGNTVCLEGSVFHGGSHLISDMKAHCLCLGKLSLLMPSLWLL